MSKNDKILVILSPGFAADEADSTCLPPQQLLVKALNRNYPGLKIVILALEYPFLRSSYLWHDNRVIPFNTWNKTKVIKMAAWVSVWRTLNRLRRENHIVGLFSFWCAECALIGKYFGKRNNIKHYTWILGQDARKDNRFVRWIRPHGEELVAMSDFLVKEFHRNHGIRPAHIIPNAVDPSLYDTTPVERDIDVLGVGSLILLKQYDLFISVIASLILRLPAIKVVICGKGPEEGNLRKMIRDLQLEENILMVGEKSHGEVLRLMSRSKILLHPSSYEGYSTVCLEALYAGCHVVSFCNPGSGWVRHWHIAGDTPEMTELTLEILEDPQTDHQRVLVYSADNNARAVAGLFGFGPAGHEACAPARPWGVGGAAGNISFYNAIAEEYDAILEKEDSNRIVRQKVEARFRDTVKEGWVLDFGGGTGQDMEWLIHHRYNVIFCEPSGGMRSKAIQHNNDILRSDRIIFLEDAEADFTGWSRELPFDRKVDAVLSNFAVLNSIGDIDLLFRNLSLVLKPRGHLFALVLNSGASGRRLPFRRQPRKMQVKYKQHAQSVFLHPEKAIRKGSAAWFEFCGSEPIDGSGFSLIHLTRK